MRVRNTKAMLVLLEALEIKQYTVNADSIDINISMNELCYVINASDEAVQNVFGHTEEWLDLIKYL